MMDEFVAALAAALRQIRVDALLPSTDAALLAISRSRERLPHSLLTWLPPDETLARVFQKGALLEEAARAGFAVPETVECGNQEAARTAAATVGFPLVVKPNMSVLPSAGGARRESARIARDDAQLAAALAAMGSHVLVQRFYARAPVLSFAGVASAGRLVAVVTARWWRRWPPLDGAAAFAETVAPPSGVAERAEALVAALGWEGIFELEVLELDGGTFAPVDFNPRPFGWMALALRAGANLPAVWAECVQKLAPRPVLARPGVRYRWEEGDAGHLLWQLRQGRARAAAAVLLPHRRVAHAYFELRDPRPLAAEIARLPRRALRWLLTRLE
jgi:predicted ATP-grasp superfamily ATP-dependent carboligase